MIPLGDDNSARGLVPFINYLLIVANVFVFVYFQQWGNDLQFTYAFAAVPAEIISGKDIVTDARQVTDPLTGSSINLPGLQPTPVPVWLTIIIAMFMHGGIAHIAGNMLFLFIFGDNIEDRLGHRRYLLFYLLTGIAATLAHVFTTFFFGHDPLIPMVGASGAISGVLGGYILLFPLNRVKVLFFPFIVNLPAFIILGLWIVFQIMDGLGTLGGQTTGIAYTAHIGGFIAGLALVKFFDRGK
jgi:membrane associated rhomboid family serine protease